MPRGTNVPITPEVLRWAIDNSGFSVTEIAEELGVNQDVIDSWTRGDGKPLLTQFKNLSNLLKRPTAFFLLPKPPVSSIPETRFRHPLDSGRTSPTGQELRFLRETARIQRTLSWIHKELGRSSLSFESVSTSVDVDTISSQIRQTLGVSVSTQLNWKDAASALKAWRDALGHIGIYVFLLPMGSNSCRGFSLWDTHAPAIAVNTSWNTEARIFTIIHELGHLLTRSNSICLSPASHLRISGGDLIERWCERFSASVLLPWKALKDFMRDQMGWNGEDQISDLDDVRFLARKFKVSLRATTIRLIDGGFSDWSLYDEIPPWSDDKRGGGGKGRTRKQMREDWYGSAATTTFVNAMDEDLISRADVLTYLNVSDSDLYNIQEQAH